MPKQYLAVAGIPHQIESGFTSALVKLSRGRDAHLVALPVLQLSESYTEPYAKALYNRVALKLKQSEPGDRENLLRNANLILLYLDKQDDSESVLVERFGIEALVLPLVLPGIANKPLNTSNQRNGVVNQLVKEVRRARKQARELFSVIAEEVTNRDNKTCLLLPPKTFGKSVRHVIDRVWEAGRNRENATQFKAGLERVAQSFPKHEGRYFQGRGQLVFQTPAKAGPRHGLAPMWEDGTHHSACVIRGRLRFGAAYDPGFHYDCQIPKKAKRDFPGCHESAGVSGARGHANIAPNDNLRYRR